MNGGSHCGLPGRAKKPVHWAAVTCFSVATVGCGVAGLVVPGSHAAIWPASVLGRKANVISEPPVTSAAAPGLRVTVVAVTPVTVLPVARPAPKADMPALMLPASAKVSCCVPAAASWPVVAARLGSGPSPARPNVTWTPVPMWAVAFWLRATVVAVTASTVVPAGRPAAVTVIPAQTPVAAPKVSREVPDGQLPVVVPWTAGSVDPGAIAKATGAPAPTSAVTPVVRVTPVAVTASTVVPGARPAPRTVRPAAMPVVSPRASAAWPAGQAEAVDAVTGAME